MKQIIYFLRYFKKRIIIITSIIALLTGGTFGFALAARGDALKNEAKEKMEINEAYPADFLDVFPAEYVYKLETAYGKDYVRPRLLGESDDPFWVETCDYWVDNWSEQPGYYNPPSFEQKYQILCERFENHKEGAPLRNASLVVRKYKNGQELDVSEMEEAIDTYKNKYSTYNLICNMIDCIFGDSYTEKETTALQVGTDTWTTTRDFPDVVLGSYTVPEVSSVLKVVNDSLLTFAIILTSVLFFIGIMNATMEQQITGELYLKRLVGWMISLAVICFATMLVLNIANVGTGILNKIQDSVSESRNSEETKKAIASLKLEIYIQTDTYSGDEWYNVIFDPFMTALKRFSYVLMLVPAWLSSIISYVIVSVISYGRAIEIYILAAFAPIAVCDITGGHGMGMQPTGRFIKNVCAIALQGAIILLGNFLCSSLQINIVGKMAGNFDSFWSVSFSMIVIAFVQVGLASKSLRISKDIIGVM